MSTITRAEKERARPATLDMGRAVAVERAVELGLEAGLLELDFEPDPEERWWLTERGAEAIGVEWGGRRGPGTLEYELDQALGWLAAALELRVPGFLIEEIQRAEGRGEASVARGLRHLLAIAQP